MPGGIDEPFHLRARSEDGGIVAAAGPEAHPLLQDGQFLDARNGPPGMGEEGELAAGREVGVEPFLLGGGAEDEAAIPARHHVGAGRPQNVGEEGMGRVHLQRQHLALHGPHRQRLGRGDVDAAAPGAGRQHDHVGGMVGAVHHHAAWIILDLLHAGVLVEGGPGGAGGDLQRLGHLAVVHLMVLGAQHRAGQLAGEIGLALARLGGAQPFHRQAEALLEGVEVPKPRPVIGGEGDGECALGAQAHIKAGGGLKVGGEARPQRLTGPGEGQEALFAGLGLGAGGQHAGGGPARPVPGRAGIEQGDPAAGGGEPPADGEADDARAHHAHAQCAGRS